jgi:hypothetical protein
MKFIVTETQYRKFAKSSVNLQNVIYKYLNNYISSGERKIGKKSRNYGNLREDWCINGKEEISAIYYFENGEIYEGMLFVNEELVKTISSFFGVRKSYALSCIEEWYDDTMVPKFEQLIGESGLYINEIGTLDRIHQCIPEPVKPEGITDDEMIDFIAKNTLYNKNEVTKMIESGERELEDFYLDIVDTVNRRDVIGY